MEKNFSNLQSDSSSRFSEISTKYIYETFGFLAKIFYAKISGNPRAGFLKKYEFPGFFKKGFSEFSVNFPCNH